MDFNNSHAQNGIGNDTYGNGNCNDSNDVSVGAWARYSAELFEAYVRSQTQAGNATMSKSLLFQVLSYLFAGH